VDGELGFVEKVCFEFGGEECGRDDGESVVDDDDECMCDSRRIKARGSIKNIHLCIFRNINFVFSVLIGRSSVFCILALGSGQRFLYRLGSGLGL